MSKHFNRNTALLAVGLIALIAAICFGHPAPTVTDPDMQPDLHVQSPWD